MYYHILNVLSFSCTGDPRLVLFQLVRLSIYVICRYRPTYAYCCNIRKLCDNILNVRNIQPSVQRGCSSTYWVTGFHASRIFVSIDEHMHTVGIYN